MFRDFVELILGELIEGDVEMRTGDIATSFETRPLEKILKPFRDFRVLSNGRDSTEICGYVLERAWSKMLMTYCVRPPTARLRYPQR
jgi:hypothetical protein